MWLSKPEGLDGHSFARMLNNPNIKDWNDVAYSYFRNGYSLRVPDYRLSSYDKKGEKIVELYQYGKDRVEKKNISSENPKVVQELMPLLKKGITFSY